MTDIRITESDISNNEYGWDVKLPAAYVNYLLTENGGEPQKRYFPLGEEVCVIERYLSLIPNAASSPIGMYDINVVLTQVDERIIADGEALGYQIIPIAALFGGDLLCYDFRENKENPEICVWDHEASEEFEPVTYYVCESWEELQAMAAG